MKPTEFWKNFKLGEELSVSGTFIYNGLRRFHELKKIDHEDDLFEVLYSLSIGVERLLKIAVVLLEHQDGIDQDKFESSLATHDHSLLLDRVKRRSGMTLGAPHKELLSLLSRFYRNFRYGRFSLQWISAHRQERDALLDFLEKHLKVEFKDRDGIFGSFNDDRYRKYLRGLVLTITQGLYKIISDRACELNMYTCELRHGSKASTVFQGNADIPAEDVLWKELLVFLMNTKEKGGYLSFLRSIDPLGFDPALVGDYLDCFQSDSAKSEVMDELEHLYEEEVSDKKTRLQIMGAIGAPGVYFPEDDGEPDGDEDFDITDKPKKEP